jgi:hypothetical protein
MRNRLLLLSGKDAEFVALITNHVCHFTVPFHYTEFKEPLFIKCSLIHVSDEMTTVTTVDNLVVTRDLTNTWIKLISEYFNSVYLGLIVHSLVRGLGHGCLFDKAAVCLKEIELFLRKRAQLTILPAIM